MIKDQDQNPTPLMLVLRHFVQIYIILNRFPRAAQCSVRLQPYAKKEAGEFITALQTISITCKKSIPWSTTTLVLRFEEREGHKIGDPTNPLSTGITGYSFLLALSMLILVGLVVVRAPLTHRSPVQTLARDIEYLRVPLS